MYFSEYLKTCRESTKLTQEELAERLYGFDTQLFGGLDTGTISKWERAIVQPKLSKQASLIRFFQSLSGIALPCWDHYDADETEAMICQVGMQNLLGRSKELVLNFPSNIMGVDDLKIYQLHDSDMIDKIIDINIDLDKGFNHHLTQLEASHFKAWALNYANTFYYCEYKGQFFGLLFTLRLKPASFGKLMNLELLEQDLSSQDFASTDETGCNYIISFFALNDKAGALLFIRYYAHLIAKQKSIQEIGVAAISEDAKKLIQKMSLPPYASKLLDNGVELQSYRETLANFLTSESIIRLILSKQACPEV
jgi:transcriptional regulator with XRE-family HTH domain